MKNDTEEIIINTLKGHIGKNNQIKAKEIQKLLGINEDDTHASTRKHIRDCIKKYNLPVAANDCGYYWIENKSELKDYIQNLESRISGIQERIKIVKSNYLKYYGK